MTRVHGATVGAGRAKGTPFGGRVRVGGGGSEIRLPGATGAEDRAGAPGEVPRPAAQQARRSRNRPRENRREAVACRRKWPALVGRSGERRNRWASPQGDRSGSRSR